MKLLSRLLIIAFSCVVINAVQAGTSSSDFLTTESHSVSYVSEHSEIQVLIVDDDILVNNLTRYSYLSQYSDADDSLSRQKPSPIPTRISAMFFRDNLQSKSIEWKATRSFFTELASLTFEDSGSSLNRPSWFITSLKKTNHRMSGWKDGNSLYAASITYH
ncbi:MAG: hypothetical protein KUG78_01285 [Kangiellaceae bacterium]|nr:hypothetical protein [Kangiellaceae bacterium]